MQIKLRLEGSTTYRLSWWVARRDWLAHPRPTTNATGTGDRGGLSAGPTYFVQKQSTPRPAPALPSCLDILNISFPSGSTAAQPDVGLCHCHVPQDRRWVRRTRSKARRRRPPLLRWPMPAQLDHRRHRRKKMKSSPGGQPSTPMPRRPGGSWRIRTRFRAGSAWTFARMSTTCRPCATAAAEAVPASTTSSAFRATRNEGALNS